MSDSEVNLSWTVPDSSVAGYNIYDGTSSNGESSTPVNSDIVTGTTFSVTGLSSGTTYYFYVTAVDGDNVESDPSDEASATTSGGSLGSPTGLTATAVSDSEVNLSWTLPDSSVAGYNIYDGTSSNGESSTPVNSDIVTGTTFSVTGLSSGTTYYFYVTAVDRANNESDPSDEAQVTTRPARAQQGSPVGPGAPAGPTGNSSKPWQTIVPLAIIPLVIGGAALMVRRRRRSRSASVPQPHTQASPGPGIHAGAGSSIQAVPHVGPPGVVSIHATGTEAMYTVRIEPHPGSASIAIEEAPRR